MNFCPQCGVSVSPDQKFCRNCGYNLEARSALSGAQQTSGQYLHLLGLSALNAYYMDRRGLASVQLVSDFAAIALAAITFLFAVGVKLLLSSLSFYGIGMVWLLVSYPFYDELRYRKLSKLEGARLDEIEATGGSRTIAWDSITRAVLGGRTLSVYRGGRRLQARLKLLVEDDKRQAAILTLESNLGGRLVRPKTHRTLAYVLRPGPLVAIIFLISQAILVTAAVAPFFSGEQELYTTLWNSQRQTFQEASLFSQYLSIFSNNLGVALSGTVPAFGQFFLLVASYNTGRVIQVISIQASLRPQDVVAVLYLSPHSLLEELSYPLFSVLWIYYWSRGDRYTIHELAVRRRRNSVKVLVILAEFTLLLAVAALFEVAEPLLGLGGLLLWIPVGAGAVYLFRRSRMHRSTPRN